MNSEERSLSSPENGATTDRRDFLATASNLAMAGGLIAGYGAFGAMALRFLYPVDQHNMALRFVAPVNQFPVGHAQEFTTPSGATVVIARHADDDQPESFIALSSVCPHLGCQVHWELQNNRFFCPCHNGVFDREGVATEGPPALAKQSLKRYRLEVVNGLLFIEAPLVSVGRTVAQQDAAAAAAPARTREA